MSQLFINIVGHNSSGKTTVAKKLEADLKLNRVSGDDFREFIHNHITYFKDTDMSYPNSRYDELNPLVIQYRLELSWVLLQAGQTVLFDGSGSTRQFRARYLAKVHVDFPKVTRVIVWVDVSEHELLERLSKRGERWVEQYHSLKKHSFQPPENNEAEIVLRYDQHNYEEVLSSLRELLK